MPLLSPSSSTPSMRIRLRHPNGQSVLTLKPEDSLELLNRSIRDTTGITSFKLSYGYPPRPLNLDPFPPNAKLSDLVVRLEGEQLIVSQASPDPQSQQQQSIEPDSFSHPDHRISKPSGGQIQPLPALQRQAVGSNAPPSARSRARAAKSDPPEISLAHYDATLTLRIMPDDNSCLFRAFNSAFFGIMDNMHELRSIIAQNIQADTTTYSAAVLDKSPDDYCRWIQSENSWGGSIELDILSKHFDIEICSIDVQTLRIDRYNEGCRTRCILVYSGIHYDVIALSPSIPPTSPDLDTKVFESNDPSILDASQALCQELQERHYFTDTAGFNVKCNDCNTVVIGERGASEHALQTGHVSFGEAF